MTEPVNISPGEKVTKIMRQSMLEGVSQFGVKAIVPEKSQDKK